MNTAAKFNEVRQKRSVLIDEKKLDKMLENDGGSAEEEDQGQLGLF